MNGDPLAGNAGTTNWLWATPTTSTGTAAPPQLVGGFKVGALWGVAYNKQAKKVFTSAFIKRHAGLE